jgi:hypothetical protein
MKPARFIRNLRHACDLDRSTTRMTIGPYGLSKCEQQLTIPFPVLGILRIRCKRSNGVCHIVTRCAKKMKLASVHSFGSLHIMFMDLVM